MDNNEHATSDFEEQLRLLEQRYILGEVEQVEQLLRRDPVLVTLLLAVYPHILHYFPDAQVFLHAVDDPESPPWQGEVPNGHQEISAFISTRLEPREAIERLTAFYEDHWGQLLQATQGSITVGLECI